MCNDGYFISYSKVNVFGVDVLFDNGCYGLVQNIGLMFYYCVCCLDLNDFGGKWRVFWWWNVGVQWFVCEFEKLEDDVLEYLYGMCLGGDFFCFQ